MWNKINLDTECLWQSFPPLIVRLLVLIQIWFIFKYIPNGILWTVFFRDKKLLPKVQASTLERVLKNMAGNSRHLIGAVSRGRRRRLLRGENTCPLPVARVGSPQTDLVKERAQSRRLKGDFWGRAHCVPSVTTPRWWECVIRCVASVASRTAGHTLAGSRTANYWHITDAPEQPSLVGRNSSTMIPRSRRCDSFTRAGDHSSHHPETSVYVTLYTPFAQRRPRSASRYSACFAGNRAANFRVAMLCFVCPHQIGQLTTKF
jgi:hypothetical protein